MLKRPSACDYITALVMLSLALLTGCASRTVLVRVPPVVDMSTFGTAGIIAFSSNADASINRLASRRFQENVQAAQPGTRFIELGTREHVLAAVGAREIDADAIKKIGVKYGVGAVILGDIIYSDPKIDVKVSDPFRMRGAVKAEVRGDISSRLMETKSGASVWSSSAWAKRQLGSMRVSGDIGISGRMTQSNPRHEMVPDLVYHLTNDFRARSIRQRVQ